MAITENDTIEVKLKPVLLPEDIDKNVKKIETRLRELSAYQERLEKESFDRRTKAGRAQKAALAEIAREQAKLTPILQQQVKLYDQISTKTLQSSRVQETANANRRLGIQETTRAVTRQNSALGEQVKLMGALAGATREQVRLDAQRAAVSQTANANRTMGVQTPSSVPRGATQSIAADIAQTNALTTAINNQSKAVSEKGGIVSAVASKRAVYYAALFAAIYGVSNQLGEAIRFTTEYDKVLLQLQAAVDLTAKQAGVLREEMVQLSITYGEQFQNISAVALELGRAGVGYNELAASIKAVNQLAILTGDTIDSSTRAIVSFVQVFNRDNAGQVVMTVEEIGAKLAFMANQSRLATQDINTLGNYALGAAKSMGMTIDQVNSLSIAMSNTGRNASTIGTNIRRFTTLLGDQTTEVQEFFQQIGVNQENFRRDIAKGGAESNKAFQGFIKTLGSFSQESLNTALAGMNILTRDTLQSISNSSDIILQELQGSLAVTSNEIDKADLVTQSLERRFQALANKFYEATEEYITPALHTILSGFEHMGELIGVVSGQLESLAMIGAFAIVTKGATVATAAIANQVIALNSATAATAVHTKSLMGRLGATTATTAATTGNATALVAQTGATVAATTATRALMISMRAMLMSNPFTAAALGVWALYEGISAVVSATSDANDELDKLASKQFNDKTLGTAKASFMDDTTRENISAYKAQLEGSIKVLDELSRSEVMSVEEQKAHLAKRRELTAALSIFNAETEEALIKGNEFGKLQDDQTRRLEGTKGAIDRYTKSLELATKAGNTEQVEKLLGIIEKLKEQLAAIKAEDLTSLLNDTAGKSEKVFTIFKEDMKKQISAMVTTAKKVIDSGSEDIGLTLFNNIGKYFISAAAGSIDELNKNLKSLDMAEVTITESSTVEEAKLQYAQASIKLLEEEARLRTQLLTITGKDAEVAEKRLSVVHSTMGTLQQGLDAAALLADAREKIGKGDREALRDARNGLAIAKLEVDLAAERAKYQDENSSKALEAFQILQKRAGLNKEYNESVLESIDAMGTESEKEKALLQWELDKQKALAAIRGQSMDAGREFTKTQIANQQKQLDIAVLQNRLNGDSTALDLAQKQYDLTIQTLSTRKEELQGRINFLKVEEKRSYDQESRKVIASELAKLNKESLVITEDEVKANLALTAAKYDQLAMTQELARVQSGLATLGVAGEGGTNEAILQQVYLQRELNELRTSGSGTAQQIAAKELELQRAKLDLKREELALSREIADAQLSALQSFDKASTDSQNKRINDIAGVAAASYSFAKKDRKNLETREEIMKNTEEGSAERKEALAALDKQSTQDQLQGYGDLAGAIAGMFEEGSSAQKAFLIAQQAIATVNAVSFILAEGTKNSWYGLAAAAAAAAGLLAMAGIAFGGSGGSAPSASEQRLDAIDMEFTPITDRLDAQIDLLEKIGTSGRVGLSRLAVESARAIQEALAKTLRGGELDEAFKETFNLNTVLFGQKVEMAGINIPRTQMSVDPSTVTTSQGWGNPNYRTSFDYAQELNEQLGFNAFMKLGNGSAELSKDGFTSEQGATLVMGQLDTFSKTFSALDLAFKEGGGSAKDYEALITNITTNFLESVGGMAELAQGLLDFRDTMGDLYDDMTGTDTFSSIKMREVRASLSDMGINTDEEVIAETKRVFTELGRIQKEYGIDIKKDLAEVTDSNAEEVAKSVGMLESILGKTFDSVEDAQNRLKDFETVAKSIANTRINTKAWEDLFKTPMQLLAEQSKDLTATMTKNITGRVFTSEGMGEFTDGIDTWDEYSYILDVDMPASIQTTMSGLTSLVEGFKKSGGEYTDAERAFAEANHDMIKSSDDFVEAMKYRNESEEERVKRLLTEQGLYEDGQVIDNAYIDTLIKKAQVGGIIDAEEQKLITSSIALGKALGTIPPIMEKLIQGTTDAERSFASFMDNFDDGFSIDFAMDAVGVDSISKTKEDFVALYKQFEATGNGIDTLEQSILNAGVAAYKEAEALEDRLKIAKATTDIEKEQIERQIILNGLKSDAARDAQFDIWDLERESQLKAEHTNLNLRLEDTQYALDEATLLRIQRDRELAKLTDDESIKKLKAIHVQEDANKELEKQSDALNDYISTLESTLESTFSSLQSVIGSLREPTKTAEMRLSDFYNAMSEASKAGASNVDTFSELAGKAIDASSALFDISNADTFSELVGRAIDASSALFETSNFQNQRDMDFAQLVAANQFEGLEDTALTQIDYLELIEENTRNQVSVLVEAMGELGADVKSSIASVPRPGTTPTTIAPALSASEQLVSSAYQAVFGREPDAGGLSYWSGRVESGSVNLSNLSTTLVAGAAANPSAQAAADYEIAKAKGYYQGGYTGDGGKYDPAGVVHRGEFVINKDNTSKLGLNQNMGNVFDSMLYELRQLKQENQEIKNYMVKLTADNSRQLQTQRAILAESLPV